MGRECEETPQEAAPCESSNSEESSSSLAYLSVESQVTGLYCRVCWDCSEPKDLVSPCACKGTQKYVHIKCLRRWQENVQKRDVRDERAFRCGVCQTHYSLAPPDRRWTAKLWNFARYLAGTACVSLLAFGLAGPPWPHLAILALFLLGTRSHSMLAVALLAAGSVIAALHAHGLRLTMHLDDGGRFGVAVVRYGAPIPGLGPGTLLVASDELENSIFRNSVVLIYEHDQFGARGVILNQPLSGPPSDTLPADQNATMKHHGPMNNTKRSKTHVPEHNNNEGASTVVLHRLGGPVGMPGEGARQIMAVLHSVSGIDGAVPVLDNKDSAVPPVYQGGRLNDVLEGSKLKLENAAAAAAGASAAARQGERKGSLIKGTFRGSTPRKKECPGGCLAEVISPVFVYHGIATWGEGQLEGEIRARAWSYGEAKFSDVLHAAPDRQWDELVKSDRMTAIP